MIAAAPQFVAALQSRYRRRYRHAELWVGGQAVRTVEVPTGSVSVDGSASGATRTVSCELIDPTRDLFPATASDLLADDGTELALFRGVVVAGRAYSAPLGVFGNLKVTGQQPVKGGLRLTLEGADRWADLDADPFAETWTVAEGTNLAQAISDIVQDTLPGVPMSIHPTALTTPALSYAVGDKRTDAVRADLAAAYGCSARFDASGTFVVRPIPDPTTAQVAWEFVEGANAQFGDVARVFDRSTVARVVVVVGNNVDPPVYGRTIDPNLIDPTTGLIAVGNRRRVWIEQSDVVATDDQAQAMSEAIFRNKSVAYEAPEVTCAVNPLLEPDDVCHLTRSSLQLDGRYVLQRLTTPVGAGGQNLAFVASAVPVVS